MTTTSRPKTLIRHLSVTDAWGETRSVTVHWIPEDMTWSDPALENAEGFEVTAFGSPDDPPITLVRNHDGRTVIRPNFAQWNGQVLTSQRVAAEEDLEPGCYWIASDTDD